MFKAIGRYFRAIGYLFTGRFDAARRTLSTNPDVVRATYDHIIDEKKKRFQQYKDAVGAMMSQQEKKKAELKRQSDEVARLRKLKDGAAAMARKVVERHTGDVEAVKADPEYAKCQAAFKDFRSTLEEKEGRCVELENDVKTLGETVASHKTQLQTLLREVEQIKHEKHEAVADLITAKEEREVSDMIAGISNDRTSEELQEMRDIRQEAKAVANVSREMAGLDAKRSEEEFLEYATQATSDNEFDRLIGLTQQTETDQQEPPDKTRLPES